MILYDKNYKVIYKYRFLRINMLISSFYCGYYFNMYYMLGT